MTGYRNKCEFTIGLGADGEQTVGFRVGRFAGGSVVVGSPIGCPQVVALLYLHLTTTVLQ